MAGVSLWEAYERVLRDAALLAQDAELERLIAEIDRVLQEGKENATNDRR